MLDIEGLADFSAYLYTFLCNHPILKKERAIRLNSFP